MFVGLQYWRERHVANGVTQAECTTASSPNQDFRCSPAGTVGFRNQAVITNTSTWVSGRFGGEVEYRVDKRISIEAKIAMLLSYLNNEDVHHLRTDLAQDPSFRMTGLGLGTNSDINLRIRIWDRLYLTGGYRVFWNRVLVGDQWKLYGSDGSSATASLTPVSNSPARTHHRADLLLLALVRRASLVARKKGIKGRGGGCLVREIRFTNDV
jgi:hypothetical protein